MKREDQMKGSYINFSVAFVALVIILFLVLAFGKTEAKERTGYLLAIEQFGEKTMIINTTDPEEVNRIVAKRMNLYCFNVEAVLHNSVFIEYRTKQGLIYIEKKTVTEKGKFRKYRK